MMIKRILIVDDSPMIHSLLSRTLLKNEYEVCGVANNGKEAVALFTELTPDLVFMDITMPIMDGLQASTIIKEKNPTANIIMLSAMGDDAVVEQVGKLGIDIFLKKPFNEYKIISAIAKLE